MNKSFTCNTHKRNFVPNHCKECACVIKLEEIEMGMQEFGDSLKDLFNSCGDKARSEQVDEIIEEGKAERERIERDYGKH
jgi:hypothetical protein